MVNWKVSNLVLKDGRKVINAMESKKNGYFTRDEIINLGQTEANKLKDANKDAMIGVAYHYKNANQWVSGIMTSVKDPVKIWDLSDSPDSGKLYEDDRIDGIYYTVIKRDDNNPIKYMKPRKVMKYPF